MNRSGKVIGVNVAISAGAENIGFALPINMVKDSIENYKTEVIPQEKDVE